MRILCVLSFFLWAPFLYANPECGYSVTVTNPTILMSDIEQVAQQNYTISRSNNSNDNHCTTYRLYISKGLANSYQRRAYGGTTSVRYNLHTNINMSGIIRDFPDATNSNEWLERQTPSKDTVYTHGYFISVPDLQAQNYPSAGIYTDNVQASFYGLSSTNGKLNFELVSPLSIRITVPMKLDIGLVDEGSIFNASATSKILDFGTLEDNEELGADLLVVSNTSYQVNLSSTNNGRFKHTLSTDTVAYELKVNGSTVGLSSSSGAPVNIGIGSNTGSMGQRYNMKVKVLGPTGNKLAGLYQDIITVTAIAN